MTIKEFLELLSKAHINYKTLNKENNIFMYPSDNEFIKGQNYLANLFLTDKIAQDLITNHDTESIKEYLEYQKKVIEDKYGDLSDFVYLFKKNDLNRIYKYFTKLYKYHQVVSFDDYLKRKGPTNSKEYFDQKHLLNDYYEAISKYDFSSFYELYNKLDLLYIAIYSIDNLIKYENYMTLVHNL